MKIILLAPLLFIIFLQSPLKEPPKTVSKALKQKFPSAMNIKWIEEDNKSIVTRYFNGKISKEVQEREHTWRADFLLGERKTSATFDLEGHWLLAQQEIKLKDIGVQEVISAIERDFHDCEIHNIIIYNHPLYGTYYEVEGKCGNSTTNKCYDFVGLPYPPKISLKVTLPITRTIKVSCLAHIFA